MDKQRFFTCECHGEGIIVSLWDDDPEVIVSLSLWRYGAGDYGITRWRNRLRHIWYILRRGHPYTDDILLSGRSQDPKSKLQEWTQGHGFGAPVYQTISAVGPDHAKEFEVQVLVNGEISGFGRGNSKQSAAKNAAREALKRLQIV